MSTDSTGHQKYYVPEKSSIPIVFAVAMLFFGFGAADAVMGKGTTMFFFGVAAVVGTMAYWFSVVTRESLAGLDTPQLNNSYVYGMAWFIFSEVMFFAAFFWRIILHKNIFHTMARWRRCNCKRSCR